MSETLSAKDAAKVAEKSDREARAKVFAEFGIFAQSLPLSADDQIKLALGFARSVQAAKAEDRAKSQEREQVYREALGRITRLLSDDNAIARIIARAALAAFEEKTDGE